jgi:site-specific recombinase XerD
MDTLAPFHTYLTAQDCAALTRKGYLSDMEHFARWFEQTNGEPLTPQAITPSDIKEYRQFLLTVERYKANTVNRRLAAISAYARWALSTGQIHSDPTLYVKSVKQVANTPKWLDKSEQYALQRAIERDLQLSRLRYPKRHVTRRRDASITFGS